MVKVEESTHNAVFENLKQSFVESQATAVAFEQPLRKESGNISVKPHNLSASDSSVKS